jgi:tetratricopeptide (TPR) repeat protein
MGEIARDRARARLGKAAALLNRPLPESNVMVIDSARYAAQGALDLLEISDQEFPGALILLSMALGRLAALESDADVEQSWERALSAIVRLSGDPTNPTDTAEALRVFLTAAATQASGRRQRITASLQPFVEIWLTDIDHYATALEALLLALPGSEYPSAIWLRLAGELTRRRIENGMSILDLQGVAVYLRIGNATGENDLLDTCIDLGRREIEQLSSQKILGRFDLFRIASYSQLLAARFRNHRNLDDLVQALSALNMALDQGGKDFEEIVELHRREILVLWHEYTGDLDRLDMALQATGEAPISLAGREKELSRTLDRAARFGKRFEVTGSEWDFERSQALYLAALDIADRGDDAALKATVLQGLSILLSRFAREFRSDDSARRALEYAERSVLIARMSDVADTLIYALHARVGARATLGNHDPENLQAAIDSCEELLGLVGDHPQRQGLFASNAAQLYFELFRLDNSPATLEKAIHYSRRAVSATSPSEPSFAYRCDLLARALCARARQAGELEDEVSAEGYWRQAISSRTSTLSARFLAVMHWSDDLTTQKDWRRLEPLLGQGIDFLTEMVFSQFDERKRLRDRYMGYGVAGAAAAAALELDDPLRALMHLEAGRNLLWAHRRAGAEFLHVQTDLGGWLDDSSSGVSDTVRRLDVMEQLAHKWGVLEGGDPELHPHIYLKTAEQWGFLGDHQRQSELLAMAALAYRRLGETQRAVELYNEVIGMLHEDDDDSLRFRASVMVNLGFALRKLGERAMGTSQYRLSLELYQRLSDAVGTARAANNLSHALYSDGDRESAVRFFEVASAAFREVNDPKGLATSLHDLAWTFREIDREQDALDSARRCLDALQIVEDLPFVQSLRQSIAELLGSSQIEDAAD